MTALPTLNYFQCLLLFICISLQICVVRYNHIFNPPVAFGPEWAEASKKSTDYHLVLSMINRFHPGFHRKLAEQGPDGTSVQGLCAERILQCMGIQNILWRCQAFLEGQNLLQSEHCSRPI